MRTTSRTGLWGWCCFAGLAGTAQCGEFILQPVSASGMNTIVGNEIRLIGTPQSVFLEVQLKSWAPSQLKGYQATIDSASYTTGTNGMITPVTGSIETTNSEYVFFGLDVAGEVVDLTSLNYRYAAMLEPWAAATDTGQTAYGGTLVLDVPSGASGSFTIAFRWESLDNFMFDENNVFIEPIVLTPGRITVGCSTAADCNDGVTCTIDTCLSGLCVHTPDDAQCPAAARCSTSDGCVCESSVPVIRIPQSYPGRLGEPRCGDEIDGKTKPLFPNTYLCLDSNNNFDPALGVLNQFTISSKGCVLTSATMTINAYLGSNWGPDQLNNEYKFLANWGEAAAYVFSNRIANPSNPAARVKTNDLAWPYVAEYLTDYSSPQTAYYHGRKDTAYANYDTEILPIIETAICQGGLPVAVRVGHRDANGECEGTHTVAAGAYRVAVGTEPWPSDAWIADPAGRNYLTLRDYIADAAYGCVQYVDVVGPTQWGTPTQVVLYMGCPAEVLITDSTGRRAGHDVATGVTFNEIPWVVYSDEWPDEDAEAMEQGVPPEIARAGERRKVAYIGLPDMSQTLHVQIVGTGDGTGDLEVYNVGNSQQPGLPISRRLVLSAGSVETFSVFIADGSGAGACCLPNLTCQRLPQNECATQNGVFHGLDSNCEGDADGDLIADVCDPCTLVNGVCIPTLSEWAMVAMAALVLSAGGAVIARRRAA